MNQRWTDNSMGNRQRTDNTMDRQYNGQTIKWTDNTMGNRQSTVNTMGNRQRTKGQTIQWAIDKG